MRMTIGQAFAWLAHTDPHRLAVCDDDGELAQVELERRSNRLARLYKSCGAGQDSTVAVALTNSTAFVLACVAVWKLGATPMPMSPNLGAHEQEHTA